MVATRDKIARIPLSVDYDRNADVLYVGIGKPVPSEGEDHSRGIVLRYSMKDNYPNGVTVIGFRGHQWDRNLPMLADIIAKHFSIDPRGVLQDLQQVK
jgi:hypothetical protein